MNGNNLIEMTASGLYCPRGAFHVDPWRPVERAIITHGHADHVCGGCGSYFKSKSGGVLGEGRL